MPPSSCKLTQLHASATSSSSSGGFLQYALYDVPSLGFVRETFDAQVDGIVEVSEITAHVAHRDCCPHGPSCSRVTPSVWRDVLTVLFGNKMDLVCGWAVVECRVSL